MTWQRRGRRLPLRTRARSAGWRARAALALGAVATVVLPGAPVSAVPPGGASSDTEGTSARVSPSTLRAGGTISFRISGFPAGETVSVKIDDGDFCSQKGVHGACVVHQQKVTAGGTVQGSFALPDDLGAGTHWLRFLASAEILDSEGRYVGVKPYSLRGDATFTVVAAGSGARTRPTSASTPSAGRSSEDGAGGTSAVPSADATDGPVADEPAAAGENATPTPGASESAVPVLVVPAPPGSADGTGSSDDPGSRAVRASPSDVVGADDRESRVPWVGGAVLALCVLLAGAWVRRSRALA